MSNEYMGERITALKAVNPCQNCGENETVCLDMHHIDPTTKEFELSRGVGKPLTKVYEECKKCASLCANCHRKFHNGLITPKLKPVDIPDMLFDNKFEIEDYYNSHAPQQYVDNIRKQLITKYPELIEDMNLEIK